ncbi:MAG TPA: FAD binding domain-containing protein [Solirubrobacteraceae bacterium]|nr:FAD binding domain-containing protein [Solirubrobacteraceae bacterium]
MREFTLHQPSTVDQAIALLSEHGTAARPVAGGTDLVAGVMRDQVVGSGMPYPSHLVDLETVDSIAGIRVDDGEAVIGAGTKLFEIAESSALASDWPMLTAAAAEVASPEIRAIGTLGGNLHQRPRCWFFRSKDFDCVKKGGDICFAVNGDNRYNAILGGRLCYIVHPSDLATVLLALDARAVVASPSGRRMVPFDEYFVGPEQDLLRETVLGPDELMCGVIIPQPPHRACQVWHKLNDKGRQTWDFALVSVAAVVVAPDDVWQTGRIVLGGVAPVPYRAHVIEQALAGRDIREALPDALAALRAVARPMRRNGYKLKLAETLIERALLSTLDR